MGRHSDGRAAPRVARPPASLLIALTAAIAVTAIILGMVALTHRDGSRPTRPVGDLTPSPSLLLSPTPRPTSTPPTLPSPSPHDSRSP
jgi:hypothetical protein